MIHIIFGGPSPEHDVSVLTGLQAAKALDKENIEVQLIFWTKSNDFYLVDKDLEGKDFMNVSELIGKSIRLKLVVGSEGGFYKVKSGPLKKEQKVDILTLINCCHGGPGEDGSLQGILDIAGINYTGPTQLQAVLGIDKLSFSALMKNDGIPLLDRNLLSDNHPIPFDGPYILKPRFGGSSVGIEVVGDSETALKRLELSQHFKRGAVIEPYRPDLFDLQIAVRSWPQFELSAIEKPIRQSGSSEILGYKDKYVGGEGMAGALREIPVKLPPDFKKVVEDITLHASELMGVRGVFRFDFLANDKTGEVYLNEVNTIPGSLSRYLFIDPEVKFVDLLLNMVDEAKEVLTVKLSSVGADGSALTSAGTIASKLA